MLKKVLALALAGAMVLGSMSAFAADGNQMVSPTKDATITVSGLADGDTVNFYQILKWDGATGTYGGWSFVDGISYSDFSTFTEGNFTSDKDAIKYIIGDPAGNPEVAMQLKSVIAGLIADKKSSLTAKAGSTVADGKSTLTIDGTNNTLGMYMALITPKDQDTVYNPVFVSADYNTTNSSDKWAVTSAATYSDKAAAKKSTVTIDKKAEQKDGSKSYDQTWTSTRPGEVVDYTVTTTIPGYGEVYQEPTFDVKDKLTDLKLASVPTVVVEGITATSGTDYTITGAVGDTTYTVSFDATFLKKIKVPTKVTITYKAEVTSTAKMNVNLEKNEVWVEYSHDPTQEDDFKVKKDDTNHYTYTIDADILGYWGEETKTSGSEIIKVGVDASGNPVTETKVTSVVTTANSLSGALEGAKFKLYKSDGTTEYTKADGSTYALTSDVNGRIKIEGLDAGTYYLQETDAPSGFIADQRKIKIEIVPTFSSTPKTYTEYWNKTDGWHATKKDGDKEASYDVTVLESYKVLVNDVEASQYTFTNEGPKKINISSTGVKEVPQSIVNTKGVELPSTGGVGTTLFYAGGAVLVLLAGVLLVSKRRIA